VLGAGGQVVGVSLQRGQVVERVDPAKFTGVDQAHEQVAHPRPPTRLVEQGVLAMENGLLQGPLAEIIVQRRPGHAEETASASPSA